MAEAPKYQNRIELLQGTLDMLILKALQRQPMHGYAIAQTIRNRSAKCSPSRPVLCTRLCTVSHGRSG